MGGCRPGAAGALHGSALQRHPGSWQAGCGGAAAALAGALHHLLPRLQVCFDLHGLRPAWAALQAGTLTAALWHSGAEAGAQGAMWAGCMCHVRVAARSWPAPMI